jgi:hypothetical protein
LTHAITDWKEYEDRILVGATTSETKVPSETPMSRNPEYREQIYRVGCLLTPDNIDELPFLAPRANFVAPATVDLRDYCIKTRNQGKLPWCAAYAATSFVSNIRWRMDDSPTTFNPEPIYRYAKSIDGSPKVDGTTLNAALQGVLETKLMDDNHCSVKTLRTKDQIKYAIHKFGCCLLGMNISKEWYARNKDKATISGRQSMPLIGGHAVLACGYNRDGIIIQNSWDVDWGAFGFALVTWNEFEREFVYGAVIDNCLYDMRMN